VIDFLHRLSASELSTLAAALHSGRLAPPFSDVSVRRYCGESVAPAVSAGFDALAADGMLPRHIASLVEAVQTARTAQPREIDLVELVRTGPEAIGATSRDTGVVVRELFSSATTEVLVVGFAVYQGREVFRRLAERVSEIPKLRVRLCLDVRRPHGDATPASELVWKFATRFRSAEWPGADLPDLYYDPRSLDVSQEKRSSLHAKCVVVDRRVALVTSANFTEAAHLRNIEVGALIRSTRISQEIVGYFQTLIDQKLLAPIHTQSQDAGEVE